MKSIFSYTGYRQFLDDFYLEKKSSNAHFSFQVFATQAGFQSKSFIKLVIDGKKNLSESSLDQLNKALKLDDKSFAYFKDLVAFNQAKTLQLKNYYFEKMISYNKRSSARMLLLQQYEYFSQWYHSTIRELVINVDFKEDFALLGSFVKPAISAKKAKESVKLLLRLGLIKKEGYRFVHVDRQITTGDEVRSLAVQNFHLQNLMLAGESISTCQSVDRDISCLIVSASENNFVRIKKEIQQFRKKMLEISDSDTQVSRVYHINFQLFPTSEQIHG